MSKTTKNLVVVLGLITIVFAGYYLYTQQAPLFDDSSSNEQTMQNMLNNTRVFMQRRQTLDQVELDITFFEDPRFQSLRSFSTPIEERPVGRQDPFADPEVGEGVSF